MKKIRLSINFLALAIIICVIGGCRKDFLSPKEFNLRNSQRATEEFTKLPANANRELKLIADNLRSAESRNPFLASFAQANGYPVWDKVSSNLIRINRPKSSNKSTDANGRQTNEASSSPNERGLFLIPLIDTVSKEVTAYIACTKYSDTTYNYKTYNKKEILNCKNPSDSQKAAMKPLLSSFAYFERVINKQNSVTFKGDQEYTFKNVNIQFKDPASLPASSEIALNAKGVNSKAAPCKVLVGVYLIIYDNLSFDVVSVFEPCAYLPEVVVTSSRGGNAGSESAGGAAYGAFASGVNPGGPSAFADPGTGVSGTIMPYGFDPNSFTSWRIYWSVYAGQAGYVTYLDQMDYMLQLTQDQHDYLFLNKPIVNALMADLQVEDYSDEAIEAAQITIELSRQGFFTSWSETVLDSVLDAMLGPALQAYREVIKTYVKIQVAIERQKDPNAWNITLFMRATREILQTGFDFAGMLPVVGPIFDIANGSWYALNGDWSNATLSMTSAVPIIGDIPAGARLIKKGTDFLAARGVDLLIHFPRKTLRKVLNLVPGDGMIGHHLIPLGVEKHDLVQLAARNGFDMNSLANAQALSSTIHTAGNHPAYSTRVRQKMDIIWNGLTAAEQADPAIGKAHILDLIDDIRIAIANNPTTPLDNLIF